MELTSFFCTEPKCLLLDIQILVKYMLREISHSLISKVRRITINYLINISASMMQDLVSGPTNYTVNLPALSLVMKSPWTQSE